MRKGVPLLFGVALLITVLALFEANQLLLAGYGKSGPVRNPDAIISPTLTNVTFNGETYDAKILLAAKSLNASFLTVSFNPAGTGNGSTKLTVGSAGIVSTKLFGNPAFYPFDGYQTTIYFATTSGNASRPAMVSGNGLRLPLGLSSQWWAFPFYAPSDFDLYVIRDPYTTLLTTYMPILILCFVPVVFFIPDEDLTNRLILLFAIVFGSLTLQKQSPVPFLSVSDFLRAALLLGAGLVSMYVILAKAYAKRNSGGLEKVMYWVPTLPFLPPVVFWIAYFIYARGIQSELGQTVIQLWVFTLGLSEVVALVSFGVLILALRINPLKTLKSVKDHYAFMVTGLGGAVVLLPLMALFIQLQAAAPLTFTTLTIYGASLAIFAISSSPKTVKSALMYGITPLLAAVVLWIVSIQVYPYLASFLTQYSYEVVLAQPSLAPGIYLVGFSGPNNLSSIIYSMAADVFFVGLLVLPAGLFAVALTLSRKKDSESTVKTVAQTPPA